MFHLALFQPDIPQNTGAIIRLAHCFDVSLEIIEPCGFTFSDHHLKRSAMDYARNVKMNRHDDWDAFCAWRRQAPHQHKRLILFSAHAEKSYGDFTFTQGDIILFGRESQGVPDDVHQKADIRLHIPMQPHARCLNLAMSAAIAAAHIRMQLLQTACSVQSQPS